jgi:hypothetical protein
MRNVIVQKDITMSARFLVFPATFVLFSLSTTGEAASHADAFSREGLVKADVADLKDTELVAHPDVPLDPARNVLWCGTLQLAWNEAIRLVGEKLQFIQQPPVVDLLDREDFTRADLDPASYVAIADFERNHVEDEIRAALEKTFHGDASPELIPPAPLDPGRDDFLAYSYLFKNLAFAQPFEENDPLVFGSAQVKNFGFIQNRDGLSYEIFEQVGIYDYQSPDDFIVTLAPKEKGDQLILAKITPGKTLDATITAVLARMTADKREDATRNDLLAVPKLNFDLRKDFRELEGLTLKPGLNARVKNLMTSSVKQLVRFQLNEKGAVLKSEAVVAMAGAMMNETPPKVHRMIFDRPFLILMKRTDSTRPYFAMWVGNASLLMPAK